MSAPPAVWVFLFAVLRKALFCHPNTSSHGLDRPARRLRYGVHDMDVGIGQFSFLLLESLRSDTLGEEVPYDPVSRQP